MTEQNPNHGHDDATQRPPGSTGDQTGETSHRYGAPTGPTPDRPDPYAASPSPAPDSGDTARFGFGFAGRTEQGGPVRTRPSRPSGGVVAALLAGALVVGALGGLAGGAGFTAVDDLVGGGSDSGSSSTGSTSSPVVAQKDVAPAADSVESVARSVLPSVVKINVKGQQEAGSGSGIVISSDGEILTNNHVVEVAGQGGEISVNFNDGSAKKATVTSGIVSALNRPVSVGSESTGQSSQDTTYPAIQTDAAINPGNSGGPLVDLSGNVVGINSSIRTASSGGVDSSAGGSIGLGFAIPIDQVWPVVEQLRKGDTPTHARLGVSVTDASSEGGLLTGAGIEQVNDGSAAEKAGVERGDVVTKVDDDIVTGSDSLVATIRGHRPGDDVTLTVVRDGKTRTIDVKLDSDEGSASS